MHYTKRHILLSLSILIGTLSLCAQTTTMTCEQLQKAKGYPYYYCDCHETSVPFHFPLDTTISDTTWFHATFADLRQGLSAYWFANSYVTFEIYAYCTSDDPSIEPITVGSNRMKEMSADEINAKIDAAGLIGQVLTENVNPYIRVYPKAGCTGHVYCYPYDQGPHSTCDNLLPAVNYMTFVRNEREDVYELRQTTTRSRLGIRWKQEVDSTCTLYITRDSCNGPVVAGPITLSDSMHLWMPDSATLATAYRQRPLFVHATSDTATAGRLTFYTAMKMICDTVDTTICEGKYLRLHNRNYRTDTTVLDTTYFGHDTLLCTRYNLTMSQPTPVSRKLDLTQKQISGSGYLFEKQYYITKFGPDTVTITHTGECNKVYYLTVNHKITTKTVRTDTTLCVGKTITLSGVTYSSGTTTLRDTTMQDADTRVITEYTIRFVEPTMEYDTIHVEANELLDGYPYENQYLYEYGTDTLKITKRETCTRLISVTVLEPEQPEPQAFDRTTAPDQRRSYKIVRDGQLYIVRDGTLYNIVGIRNKE